MSDLFQQLSADFNGLARLFPLPDLVLFPHVVQPLHIFEPRYVEMIEHALMGDQLIAMSLLKKDWASDYSGEPPVFEDICVGRIITHAKQENGRYNILLAGIARAKIMEELPQDRLYRQARVRLMADKYHSNDEEFHDSLQSSLREHFLELLPQNLANNATFSQFFQGETDLSMLVDVMAFALPLQTELKQKLLGETGVEARAEMLLAHFRTKASNKASDSLSRRFPPDFSTN